MRHDARHLILVVFLLGACAARDDEAGETAAGPGIVGRLVDGSGRPVAGVEVLACQATSCAYADSDAEGRFEFELEPPAQIALKTHPNLATTPRLAAALEPVDLVDDALVDLGTVYVPELPTGSVIGPDTEDPQTLAAGDGLELTLNRADLIAPIGEFVHDLAARRIPAEHVPHYPDLGADLGGDHILAVYALHPFATTSTTPIAVRVPVDLPDGTTVRFHVVSELDGNCSPAVTGQVEGGYATTDPGTGITRLTYLIVTM